MYEHLRPETLALVILDLWDTEAAGLLLAAEREHLRKMENFLMNRVNATEFNRLLEWASEQRATKGG